MWNKFNFLESKLMLQLESFYNFKIVSLLLIVNVTLTMTSKALPNFKSLQLSVLKTSIFVALKYF